MGVAAGNFRFWQGVAEASMPGGPWPSAASLSNLAGIAVFLEVPGKIHGATKNPHDLGA